MERSHNCIRWYCSHCGGTGWSKDGSLPAHDRPLGKSCLPKGKLEPECRNIQKPLECAALSIAISLKRIADPLDGKSQAERAVTSFADVLNALPFFLNKWGNQ